MDQSEVPRSMREAYIAPIYKGGDQRKANAYRPIALTTHLSKLLERIIKEQLVEYLEIKGLMDPNQHGGRAGRSTITQLLCQYDFILEQLI